jgi:hypothetical protein
MLREHLWPLDETYRAWILEDIICTDKEQIIRSLETIEIKMIYRGMGSIVFLIVCIGRRTDNKIRE